MASSYNQFYHILSSLRRTFSRSPIARQAREGARITQSVKKKDGTKAKRLSVRYMCAECNKLYKISEIQVDHINPVIPIGTKSSDMTWDEIISNLFCDVSNLQVLCTKCHKIKSSTERKARAAYGKNSNS